MPKVSIIIIGFKSKAYLPKCFESFWGQTYPRKEIIFIDNHSRDGSVEFTKKEFPKIKILPQKKNLGYARAANFGIKKTRGDYVLIANSDVILERDYLEKAVAQMQKDRKIGALTGKILKYDFARGQKTKIIDTVGLFCFRNRRIIDLGQGLEDRGQFEKGEFKNGREVFGVSGACPLYRRKALEEVKIIKSRSRLRKLLRFKPQFEYFDEDFFMYKEDVDLSWRLRLLNCKCFYLPGAIGYHARGTGVFKRFTHRQVLKNRRKLSRFQKYYAFKNQRLMQVKNELWQNFLRDFFPILGKEILIFGYLLLREPYLLKAFFHFLLQLKKALRKRKIIMAKRKADWREMQKWFHSKPLI